MFHRLAFVFILPLLPLTNSNALFAQCEGQVFERPNVQKQDPALDPIKEFRELVEQVEKAIVRQDFSQLPALTKTVDEAFLKLRTLDLTTLNKTTILSELAWFESKITSFSNLRRDNTKNIHRSDAINAVLVAVSINMINFKNAHFDILRRINASDPAIVLKEINAEQMTHIGALAVVRFERLTEPDALKAFLGLMSVFAQVDFLKQIADDTRDDSGFKVFLHDWRAEYYQLMVMFNNPIFTVANRHGMMLALDAMKRIESHTERNPANKTLKQIKIFIDRLSSLINENPEPKSDIAGIWQDCSISAFSYMDPITRNLVWAEIDRLNKLRDGNGLQSYYAILVDWYELRKKEQADSDDF